jgi:hypothetical protein
MKKMVSLILSLVVLSPVVLSAAHAPAAATPTAEQQAQAPGKPTATEIMKEDQSESTDTFAIPLDKSAEEDEMLLNKMEKMQKKEQSQNVKPAATQK